MHIPFVMGTSGFVSLLVENSPKIQIRIRGTSYLIIDLSSGAFGAAFLWKEVAAEQGAEARDEGLVAQWTAGAFTLTHGYGQFGLGGGQKVLLPRAYPAGDLFGQPVAFGHRVAAPGHVGRRAGPRPVLGPLDQAGLDGVPLDVSRRGQSAEG